MPRGRSFYDLHDTIAARWRATLAGSGSSPRPHWITKVAHYRAVVDALTRAGGGPITWRDVVTAVGPRGSASTFYDVAGRHAKYRLVDAYRNASDANSLQIALDYHRTAAIDHLIDETKAWSFWEYREAFLRTHRGADRLPTGGYLHALAAWAGVNPLLAAALDHAPPMCAVEDLVALHRGGLAAIRARRWLTDVVREAAHRSDSPAPSRPSGSVDTPVPARTATSSPCLASPRRSAEHSPAADDVRRPGCALSTPAPVGS